MEKVLSQDEIDALLKGVATGEVETAKKAPPAPTEVTPFNFGSHDRVVRGRMAALDIIHDRFVKLFAVTFSAALHRAAAVTIKGMEIVKFGVVVNRLPLPSSLTVLRMDPLRGHALMAMEAPLVYILVDHYFGGSVQTHIKPEGRDFTPIQRRIVRNITKLALGDLEKAWKAVYPVKPDIVRMESNPEFAQVVAASLIQPLREDLTRIKEEVRSLSEIAGRSAPAARPGEGRRTRVPAKATEPTPFVPSHQDGHAVLVEGLPESLVMTYDRLVERGLEHEAVVSFVRSLQNTVPRSDLRRPEKLRACLHRLVARQVRTSGPLLEPLGPSKAVMVVGPTGVGKTTTIAKLAAHYAVKHKRKVALITLDTYRVAAVEQLRIYGQILGLGVDVALTSKDLGWFLDKRKQADLILIDTAGRSPLDETALHDLKKSVPPGRPVEVHLVLSASTREADLEAIAAKYSALPVHRLIFSKLDETDHFGSIFNLMKGSNLPLSYLSTGQCVPVDLELATPDLVADLLLDGRPALVTGGPGTNTRKES